MGLSVQLLAARYNRIQPDYTPYAPTSCSFSKKVETPVALIRRCLDAAILASCRTIDRCARRLWDWGWSFWTFIANRVLCVSVWFDSVRSFFLWFLGCSLISQKSAAMDATAPATDSPVSRVPITVVCSPCISHKRALLRRQYTYSIFRVISDVAYCSVMLVTHEVTWKLDYTCAQEYAHV